MSGSTADTSGPSRHDRPLRIGLCGLGSIGMRHGRLLARRGDVEVHVHDPALRTESLADLDDVSIAASVDDLLSNAPDGIIIATPDVSHAPIAINACRAGVPVLVEKPVSDSLSAALEMDAVATDTGVPVLVGHVLRHTAVLTKTHELLAAGSVGTPVSFHATVGAYETLEMAQMRFIEDRPDRLVFDYVHEWDYLQWLLGEVERCVAVGHRSGDLDLTQDPNVVDVLMTTTSGVSGTVHLDYVERLGARATRIVGDRGVLECDLRAGGIRITRTAGTTEQLDLAEDRDVAFDRQLDHFLDVIRSHAPVAVPIATAARAVAVAEAVMTSYRDGVWVEIGR